MAKRFLVTAVYPAITVNEGSVVSLQAEHEVWVRSGLEKEAVKEFRDLGLMQAVDGGPWVSPKNAAAYLVKEISE